MHGPTGIKKTEGPHYRTTEIVFFIQYIKLCGRIECMCDYLITCLYMHNRTCMLE